MLQNYTIKDEWIAEDDVKKMLAPDAQMEDGQRIYIIPEFVGEKCVVNEYTPDLYKIAIKNNVPCRMVYDNDNYEYLSLRDSEILLPFLVSVAAGACYDLLKHFIVRYFSGKKNLKVRLITKKKKETEFRKIEIKGDADGVLQALDILREDIDGGI